MYSRGGFGAMPPAHGVGIGPSFVPVYQSPAILLKQGRFVKYSPERLKFQQSGGCSQHEIGSISNGDPSYAGILAGRHLSSVDIAIRERV